MKIGPVAVQDVCIRRQSWRKTGCSILRLVIQEDEWKLMVAGGVLGTIAGALQATFFFGGLF